MSFMFRMRFWPMTARPMRPMSALTVSEAYPSYGGREARLTQLQTFSLDWIKGVKGRMLESNEGRRSYKMGGR